MDLSISVSISLRMKKLQNNVSRDNFLFYRCSEQYKEGDFTGKKVEK